MLLYRVGLLLICAALLALKQLTETTDNVYRYGLLQKLGAGRRQINHTLFVQTAVFFAIPLVVAGVYSAFLIGKAMAVVEEFMNIHIATNIGLTIVLFCLSTEAISLQRIFPVNVLSQNSENWRSKLCCPKM